MNSQILKDAAEYCGIKWVGESPPGDRHFLVLEDERIWRPHEKATQGEAVLRKIAEKTGRAPVISGGRDGAVKVSAGGVMLLLAPSQMQAMPVLVAAALQRASK